MPDEQQTTLCSACGAELQLGDYPFCPHSSTRAPLIPPESELPSEESIRKTAAICAGLTVLDGRCLYCDHEIQIGDYPFCPHGSIRSSHAQGFDPIVVHVSEDGQYRFPASTGAPVPAGYRKVEIRSIQEADRVSREVNTREDSTLRAVQHQSEENRAATRYKNREFMDSIRHKLSPVARQFLDRAREYQAVKDKERANNRPRSTNFHMDVFAHDASNREQHSDERTGWKSRKG